MQDELSHRTGLPPDLLTLLDSLPRSGWADVPGFEGLAAFWLDRHLAFRRMLDLLATDARAVADARMGREAWHPRLTRLGGHLVQDLLGHHQIEDEAYFPQMQRLEPRLQRGFDILDRDHHALDGLLRGFVDAANAALAARDSRVAGARLHDALAPFAQQLQRHLEDEEDLIIPVILKHRMG